MGKDFSEVNIIFVLGGPGAGKGTLCEGLSEKCGFAHYSAGDLLRKAAKAENDQGKMLRDMMAEGKIVPSHITIGLLKEAIENTTETNTFLIDGFPRSIEQGEEFEETITKCRFVIFLEAAQDIMQERILQRAAETSGDVRNDDNIESLKKRFKTHYETCFPVIGHYMKQDKVAEVDATRTREEVAKNVLEICQRHLKL